MKWMMPPRKGGGSSPLYVQIMRIVESAIERGELRPGDRLPSVADLARRMKVNKATAVRAFRELERKGLLQSQVGRGSFVADSAAGRPFAAPERHDVSRSVRRLRETFASGIAQLLAVTPAPGSVDLRSGVPPDEGIPDGLLRRLCDEVTAEHGERLYSYTHLGSGELVEALVPWLRGRGYDLQADQVLITNGSQQAIALAATWARDDERSILCETPTFVGVPRVFSQAGHLVESVVRDAGALRLDELGRGDRRALLYTCAEFHNPTGECLSAAGRAEIVDVAARSDTVVLVDDIFRDMRFSGEEGPSLYNALPPGRRLLVGSFSKSFMPGLRAGFLVADRPLVETLAPIRRYMDLGASPLPQAVMARFLGSGGYAEHLERMRDRYRERAQATVATLGLCMPDGVSFTRPEGGFQLWVRMPIGCSSVQLFLAALERGVAITPGPAHDIDGRYLSCFRIGYGHPALDELTGAIERLGELVSDVITRGPQEPTATGLGVPL
jgi:DNA-binding transcriptional MocR family regulator